MSRTLIFLALMGIAGCESSWVKLEDLCSDAEPGDEWCGESGTVDSDTGGTVDSTDTAGETGTETGDDTSDTDSGETGDDTGPGPTDADGDGYDNNVDCNDADADINPAATEACNNVDDDCDGATDGSDAAGQTTYYNDADGDGHGDAATEAEACDVPVDAVTNGDDCDDTRGDIHPGASETDCTDATDYNCDGSSGMSDNDADGFAACEECDDDETAINPDATEVCDGSDNDCDGDTDADDASVSDAFTAYVDDDADGFGTGSAKVTCDMTGYTLVDGDCDDANADANPGETEVCDGSNVDEDCDGGADDDDADGAMGETLWHEDADVDGYGSRDTTVTQCDAPTGWITGNGDCDDTDAAINEGATEVCDDVDNNCDDAVDEDSAVDASTWYRDDDRDGYGNSSFSDVACDAPTGFVADATDCDDTTNNVNPAATETCDGGTTDEDCDGLVDDDDPSVADQVTWYVDADTDGHGDAASAATLACEQPTGYVVTVDDCDDGDNDAYPGNGEHCDGSDNDCSGVADDGTECFDDDGDGLTEDDGDCDDADASITGDASYYEDGDGDGYGDDDTEVVSCGSPGAGYITVGGDCDDGADYVNPGATELSGTAVDDDCSGTTTRTGYTDSRSGCAISFTDDVNLIEDQFGLESVDFRGGISYDDHDGDGTADDVVVDDWYVYASTGSWSLSLSTHTWGLSSMGGLTTDTVVLPPFTSSTALQCDEAAAIGPITVSPSTTYAMVVPIAHTSTTAYNDFAVYAEVDIGTTPFIYDADFTPSEEALLGGVYTTDATQTELTIVVCSDGSYELAQPRFGTATCR